MRIPNPLQGWITATGLQRSEKALRSLVNNIDHCEMLDRIARYCRDLCPQIY